jgi:hypothetical protein
VKVVDVAIAVETAKAIAVTDVVTAINPFKSLKGKAAKFIT